MTNTQPRPPTEVSGLLDIMAQSAGAAFTPADITQLRKEYSVK